MACLVQNSSSTAAHLPVHENLSKKRKLASPDHFKNKRVQRIHDTTTSPPWTPLDNTLTLEQEAIQYFHRFYCKDCQMDQQAAEHANATSAAAANEMQPINSDTGGLTSLSDLKQEPPLPMSPQQTTDEASLMGTLDKNKESLKRKLMMRRSLIELVDQGIYPSPKTPPAFMEQRKSLERAKIGDTLRFKISHRPDRQQLVQQHILEDTNIDPSLHDRQRQLKKARLADSLNDKLSHRPGVLELVQGNIIQTESKLHQLIKEGSLSFDKANDLEIGEDVCYGFEDSKSSDDTSNEHTNDSNHSVISSSPVAHISITPELPTSFAKSLTFPAQIQFHQDSKVTVPLSTQQFSIPLQTTGSGAFTFCASSGSFVSPRNNVTVSAINNNIKSRPKKCKPKPQPKAKIIKFHEYKGPPNVIKCSPPVTSAAFVNVTANNIATQQNQHQQLQQQQQSDTPYHILLQQQQLFLQWQLEFGQKNLNATTLLVTSKQEAQPGSHVITSNSGSMTNSSSMSNIIASAAEAANVTMTTPATSQTMFTMKKTGQHAQLATQVKQIGIISPVVTSVKQELPVGQPLPQLNPNVTPVTSKQPLRRPNVIVNNGTTKVYSSLEDMKVAELKAELKKRNLTVSGSKPQLIERLKPYADAIIKSPSGSVTSPSSPVVSPSGSVISSRAGASPHPFSVLSPTNSVKSPDTIVIPSKTGFISPTGFVMSSSASDTKMSLPVVVPTFSCVFSQPSYVQSQFVTQKSPGSSAGSVTSPASTSHAGSVLSRPGSVMSPLGSVIDETLCSNAESPLPSIQSMQSAVSVSNMALMPEDLSNPFSPPSSPLYMDNVMTPLSPDIMDTHVASPGNSFNSSSAKMYQLQTISIGHAQQNQTSNAETSVDQNEYSSVMSAMHTDVDKVDLDMDVDLDLNSSLSTEIGPPQGSLALEAPVTSLPYSEVSQPPGIIQQQHDDQYQILRHIQLQLALLQERQKQQQKQQQTAATSYQLSHEELLKQQQEKIEKLQAQLEESQLRLQLQQLQHQQLQQQQLQQQQQQFHQLQQQHLQQHVAHHQMVQQQQASPEFQVSVCQSSVSPQQAMQTQSQLTQTIKTEPQPHQPMQIQTQSTVHTQASMQTQPKVIIKMQPQMPVSKNSHNGQPTVSIIPTQSLQAKKSQKVMEQSTQNQKPARAVQQPVIFSVPNLPNGTKAPTLANLPSNMKQIQIPAHLMQAFQSAQGVPAVLVSHNPKASTTKKTKPPSLEFFRNQAINQSLSLGGGKSLIAVSTCSGRSTVSTSSAAAHQFIITTAPVTVKSSTASHFSSISSNFNGLSQSSAQKMHSSLPASPVEGNNQSVGRSSSNPYFIPMKEPPRYDDAVRTKHSKNAESGVQENIEKSQTMDDVLEILIRTGELPASAANEPPPTPKTATQSASTTVPVISVSQSNVMSLPNNEQRNQSVVFSLFANQIPGNIKNEDMKENIDNDFTSSETMVARTSTINVNKPEPYTEIKMEYDCNIKMEAVDSVAVKNSNTDNANSEEFFYFNDVMNCDLSAMDWTPDPAFADLDLTDTTGINTVMDLMRNEQSLLNIPTINSPQRSMHGSEPDLANLGLVDMETNCNMQLDVPDWLDVIMPNTGLTLLNANTPISFPADPILTPQTQREVLDLFTFDESDLNTPSDLTCGNSWDKLTGTPSG